jgi:metal-responsive CopG/Arc/MetJ family transcriptional regulator
MKPRDPSDALFVCSMPVALLAEIDALASELERDRATLVRELLGEALRVRSLARAIDDEPSMHMEAIVIPFPRPSWAVDLDGEGA